ncbi:MAG: acetolactate synthase, partial [Actinomycetales bacterium]
IPVASTRWPAPDLGDHWPITRTEIGMDEPPGGAAGIPAHGGAHVIAAARAHGIGTCFTLSGAHVFPVYDAAVGGKEAVLAAGDPRSAEREGPVRLVDTRHEQTAVFAAEAMGKLTRIPGLAVLTAGPGVTNGITAITGASFNGSPLLVIGGRSPDGRWGAGALQELDQPPILATVTKSASTVHQTEQIGIRTGAALDLAGAPHRGPVFLDIPMDVLFSWADLPADLQPAPAQPHRCDPDLLAEAARLIGQARHPVLVVGSDAWMDDAVDAVTGIAQTLNLPVIANGMGRGILPPEHPLLVTRARAAAFAAADLVIVVGTPLDFRLGYGVFGDPPAQVIHIVDDPSVASAAATVTLAGGITAILDALTEQSRGADPSWATSLREATLASRAKDQAMLASAASPSHPARSIGELLPRLTADSIVIGDGGDFVSFAGKFIEPQQPGRWLDPGPYGALGTGPGYAMAARIAHPQSPVFLLMGDGAAGFSFMDVESLLRHRMPVVIVIGNNAGWALEKHPMRFLYGYDVIADLPSTRFDLIAQSFGCGGELVSDPDQIGPALDRALASGMPYVVNVLTDPEAAYPRSTTGV